MRNEEMTTQQWIDSKFAEIAKKLPTLVHTEPASFACGFNTGYKQALLELDRRMLEDDISFYHCAHCREDVCFNIECPVCGLKDEE